MNHQLLEMFHFRLSRPQHRRNNCFFVLHSFPATCGTALIQGQQNNMRFLLPENRKGLSESQYL